MSIYTTSVRLRRDTRQTYFKTAVRVRSLPITTSYASTKQCTLYWSRKGMYYERHKPTNFVDHLRLASEKRPKNSAQFSMASSGLTY